MDIVDDFVTSFYQDDEAKDHEAQWLYTFNHYPEIANRSYSSEEEDGEFYDSYQTALQQADSGMATVYLSDVEYDETFGQEELDFLEEWIDENVDIYPSSTSGSAAGGSDSTEC